MLGCQPTLSKFAAHLKYHILANAHMKKVTKAVIAGLFRQQLKVMVNNARDTIDNAIDPLKAAKNDASSSDGAI